MLCVIINDKSQCNIVQGAPDILIEESDFTRLLRDVSFRKNLFRTLHEELNLDAEQTLIGSVGTEKNGVFVDYRVKEGNPILFQKERELGVYEKL